MFLPLERITSEQIADEIISFLTENGIPVTDIRGGDTVAQAIWHPVELVYSKESNKSLPSNIRTLQWSLPQPHYHKVVLSPRCPKCD